MKGESVGKRWKTKTKRERRKEKGERRKKKKEEPVLIKVPFLHSSSTRFFGGLIKMAMEMAMNE